MIPLNEQAYSHLQKLIMENKFSYQEIYSETKIAKELGISRTPFRDAVHRLAQEGYIDIIPNKGFMLHQLDTKDVNETFQVRAALENYCTMQICKESSSRKAKKLFKELHNITDSMEKIMVTSHSIDDFCEYDFKFHAAIINYLENEQFSSIFAAFMYRMIQLAKLSLSHKGRMEDTCQEHNAILKCMESGDMNHIYEITNRHMETPKGINLEDLV